MAKEKKTVYVLTVSTVGVMDDGEFFVHIFHHYDNAVNYVVNKYKEKPDEVRETLNETNAYEDDVDGVSYCISPMYYDDAE